MCPRSIKDAALQNSRALPNGAATVYSTGIDLGLTSRSDFVAGCELLIEAPAIVVGNLADAATMKWSIEHDTDPAFGTTTPLETDALTQTGAGGAGAAAASARVGLPSDVKRYVRLKGVKSGAGDASATSATLSLVF